jgi:Zn-dependent metalloprotease
MNTRITLLAATLFALPAALPLASAFAAAPVPAVEATLMDAPSVQSSQANASLLARLASNRGEHGLDARHNFVLAKQHPGVVGTVISRADHTFKGVRIFGSESIVVSDTAGNIVSEEIADRRSGLTRGDLDVAPAVTAKAAIAAASSTVPTLLPAVTIAPAHAELIVFPVMKTVRTAAAAGKAEADLNAVDLVDVVDSYQLAYLVKTRIADGATPRYHDTIVSARTGAILKQWNMVQTVAGTGNSQYNGAVPLNTQLSGSTYRMVDTTRGTGGTYGAMAITNANHGTTAGAVYTNATNTWGDGKQYISGGSTTNANGQTAAVNAMWGLRNTYDMLKNVLGWQSLDGRNTATYIAAHVNTAYDNAYYSDTCRCMFIGDGSSFYSLGSIDVIGHEMSHGVTAATSNLTYSGESGGLNESASDIGGEAVEAYARAGGTGTVVPATGNDWVMGKEISKSGTPLRYLYKPSKDGSSPDAWSSSIKSLDVHYSSGPNNRMFYFLAKGSNATTTSDYYSRYLVQSPKAMTGIGTDHAYRIWFRALTTKFTSSTNYADARTKMIASATELYGAGSKEVKAVTRAYAAINVGADIAE